MADPAFPGATGQPQRIVDYLKFPMRRPIMTQSGSGPARQPECVCQARGGPGYAAGKP